MGTHERVVTVSDPDPLETRGTPSWMPGLRVSVGGGEHTTSGAARRQDEPSSCALASVAYASGLKRLGHRYLFVAVAALYTSSEDSVVIHGGSAAARSHQAGIQATIGRAVWSVTSPTIGRLNACCAASCRIKSSKARKELGGAWRRVSSAPTRPPATSTGRPLDARRRLHRSMLRLLKPGILSSTRAADACLQ
jgi:hypothetical protein